MLTLNINTLNSIGDNLDDHIRSLGEQARAKEAEARDLRSQAQEFEQIRHFPEVGEAIRELKQAGLPAGVQAIAIAVVRP